MASNRPKYRPVGAEAGKGMSLAFEFAGAVFLFWFLGKLVENWLGIEPWGQVVGGIVGWIGGVLHVYYASRSRSQIEAARKGSES
jgi:F0F1-type ATP synthase assembly protein I